MQKAAGTSPKILLAEHGLSCLIKVYAGAEEHIVLMDAAVTPSCLFNNVELLKADLGRIEVIVLSHGHPDHFLGLVELLTFLSKERDKEVTLFLRPDAFPDSRMNLTA